MPIDPKKIEEWRATYLRVVGTMAESPDVARIVAEAFPALLAEREEILSALAPLVRDIGDPIPEMVRRAVEWGLARDGAREEMLALLRKIQWQGDISEGAGNDALCPACLGTPQRGHGPDCRLAAFLGT